MNLNELSKQYEVVKMDHTILTMTKILKSHDDIEATEKQNRDTEINSLLLKLLWLSAKLWSKTNEKEYLETLVQCAFSFRRKISQEEEEYYGYSVNSDPEYCYLLQIIMGEECYQKFFPHQEYPPEDPEEDVLYSFCITTGLFYYEFYLKENMPEAALDLFERMENYSYGEDEEFAKGALYGKHAYYHYVDSDPEMAYSIYLPYKEAIAKAVPGICAKLELLLSIHFEGKDQNLCLELINHAYELWKDHFQESKDLIYLRLRVIHAVFNHIYREGFNNISEIYEVFEELNAIETPMGSDEEHLYVTCAYFILHDFSLLSFEERLKIAKKFYEIALKYPDLDSTIYNRQTAAYLMGNTYYSSGQTVLAEHYLRESIQCDGNYPTKNIALYATKILMVILEKQGNYKEIRRIGRPLYERLAKKEDTETIDQGMKQYIVCLFSDSFALDGKCNYAYKLVEQMLDHEIIIDDGTDNHIVAIYASLILNSIRCGTQYKNAKKLRSYIKKIETSSYYQKDWFAFDRKNFLNTIKALLEHKLGNDSVYHEIKDIIPKISDVKEWEYPALLTSYKFCLCISNEVQDWAYSTLFAEGILKLARLELDHIMLYQRRERVKSAINVMNICFLLAYEVFRITKPERECYEEVLNWKSISSLVASFRNKAYDLLQVNKEKISELNVLLDKKAALHIDNMDYLDANLSEEEENSINLLEFQLAKQMNQAVRMKRFSIEELEESLPENSAFLDYLVHYEGYSKSVLDPTMIPEEMLRLDLYCFVKKDGKVSFRKIALNGNPDNRKAYTVFSKEIQHEYHKKLTAYQSRLYQWLIEPVEDMLTDISDLYIAPDGLLHNFPFDLLMNKNRSTLGELYTISMLESGRDMIRKSTKSYNDHYVVIGDPAFDIQQDKMGDTYRRELDLENPIYRLPFSELECNMIADKLHVKPYTDLYADKHIIDLLPSAKWVHLATHGTNDLNDLPEETWYSSAILLAGVENWRKTGSENSFYGNGILTADEISRLDLSGTELVVLSACFAGSSSDFLDLASVRAAFRDAGVKYVVSALWAVGDIPATLLMQKFYQYLDRYSIPESLRKAKNISEKSYES